MAVPQHVSAKQFGPLYHGTGAELAPGDEITPQPHRSPDRAGRPMAFASEHRAMAQSYAEYAHPTGAQGTMFGHVYEVEPMDDVSHQAGRQEVMSSVGFRVKKHVSSHPIMGDR